VTGATSGIGAAVGQTLAASGVRVFLLGRNPRKLAAAARRIPARLLAGTALADLVRRLELPQKLRDVGVRREDFSAIAEKVLHDFAIRGNPRPVTAPAQVMEILDLAW